MQLGALREVDVDADQRRREATVFRAGDFDFGLDRRARTVDVPGVGEARDGDGFASDRDRRSRLRPRQHSTRRLRSTRPVAAIHHPAAVEIHS